MKYTKRYGNACVCFSLIVIAFQAISWGQVSTGTAPFGSFGGGPFDKLNLGNLNVHFTVPVRHKAGRGLPFDYALEYDNSVWYPVGVSGNQVWQPVSNFGWTTNWGGTTGYLTFSHLQNLCYDNMGHPNGSTDYYQGWSYHDPWTNSVHPFTGYMVIYPGVAPVPASFLLRRIQQMDRASS